MKLLWTIGNWKRTGPVEPSLDLALYMKRRGHAVTVWLGQARSGQEAGALEAAKARGLAVGEPPVGLYKHWNPLRDRLGLKRLARAVVEAGFDGVVTTLRGDHHLLWRGLRDADVPVYRLWFGADGETPRREQQALAAARRVFAFSKLGEAELQACGVAHFRLRRIAPPLDIAALQDRVRTDGDPRARYDVPPAALLIGIVARIQRHRHFELLWDAVELLKQRQLPFHLLVIGRGTHADEIAHEPVKRRGLGRWVTFTGYLRGSAYASTLAGLDAQLLLVPGSDPTCRALREGMALGVAGFAARRGMLPEIVDDGVTGRLFSEDAASLADVLAKAIRDPQGTRALGRGAARAAAERYAAGRVAEDLEAGMGS